MQFLQDNFFYHSDSRLGADGGLEDERHLLVEEQKLCRTRARKFSLETNRRRKALEERRKQWDMQEQRLRQNILQQRRQRVQDATERFQRAHLPPSQKNRPSFKKIVPNIEDALNQIQGALSLYSHQSSFVSSNSNISRSCTPSPKPPTVSKSPHRQALSAVEAYTKLLQEQSMTWFMNSQQTEKIQDKQSDHNSQDSHLSDCCNSESLSSKDSLENEDPNDSTKKPPCSYSSYLLDSEKPHPGLRKKNDLYQTSDGTSFSTVMLLGDNSTRSGKLHEPKQKKQDSTGTGTEDSEGHNSKLHVSKASWGFTPDVKMPKTETKSALPNYNLFTLCEVFSADPEHFDVNSPQNSPSDNTIVTNGVAPGNTALQTSCPKQEALLDLRQQRVYDDRQLKHPSATEVLLPAKNGNSKDILFGTCPKPNIFLNDSTTDNASQDQTGREIHDRSSQKEPSATINNLNKVSTTEPKAQKPNNTTLLQQACLSNMQSDTFKCLKHPEEEAQKLPTSVKTSHSIHEVRFIKGILKKQSKYVSGDTTYVYGSGNLVFAKQVALAIKDSVELTRTKTKDVQNNGTIKKKLRWYDEVHVENEDKKQDLMRQMKSKSSNPCQSSNNKDHQLSLTTVSGASKPGPSMTPSTSTSYHFTRQAWADVGVQVSLPQERADEVKVPWSSTRAGGPKVPRRERSARAGGGPVSSRTRKGTVIRPQSATEVSQIAKTQGKIMVPRPPPRMESVEEKTLYITKTPYGVDHASVDSKQTLAAEPALHKNNSECLFSPYTQPVIRTDSTVMCTLLPVSYTCPVSEVSAKGKQSSGHQETQGCSRRKGMVYAEKGLCLNCTPTDEEISHLWHGVRSALATKDAKNKLRRQALESGQVVMKPCVEQSRQPPGSGNRRFLQSSQSTKQTTEPIKPFSSTYNVASQDEGLQSVSQLHLAEVHPEGLLEERDIAAAMETAQTQRSGTEQQHSRQQGLTTISLEEQKILRSLERLNHQLFCVREHVGSNTGSRGLILTDGPSTGEVKVTNHHRHRAPSTNSRSRHQKKF